MVSYVIRANKEDKSLNELLEYPLLFRNVLINRGITTNEAAQNFFSPDYERDTHDPFLLKGMEEATARIIHAIERKEKIVIYSDYDADGIPGGAMLRAFFEKIEHDNTDTYIPHRHDEGFGLHESAVEEICNNGAKLIITVDCGITDVKAAKRAKECGVDLIITDHHEAPAVLPEAFAIVNPKQLGCTYPEQILCGAGVAYKLVQGIIKKNRFNLPIGHEKWLLDLVAIATLSDMVPLTGENRAIAHFGLKVLRKSPRPGLQSMWKKLRVNQNFITEDDIGFSFTPRINAASRMGHPIDAFRLLSAKSPEEAAEAVEILESLNAERKGVVASMVKEAKKVIKERELIGPLPNVLVLGNPHWKPSLLGLVANSLSETLKRPTFLWGRNGDEAIKGSCRSYGGINLVELMSLAGEVFVQFGGHSGAGGFEVKKDQVFELEIKINDALKRLESKSEDVLLPEVDGEVKLRDVNWSFYDFLQKLAPFGVGNPKPVFAFPNVCIAGIKQFGVDKNHLELLLEDTDGSKMKAIKFFAHCDSFSPSLLQNEFRTILGCIEKSTFGRGGPELRIRIIDII
jgi:single-stranded-DNA-specific exonuclease